MQDNKQLLPFQFFIFSVRNYLWAIAAALCILGGAGSYSATVMVKAPIQKFFLFALGSTSCVASLAVLHQFIKAESMFNTSEESAQMGWRELNVKAFAPIDQRVGDGGSGDEVEAEDPDLNFWEEINSYDPPIRAIALVLASFNIRTSLREDIDPIEEMDDRVRLHFKFPQSSEPGKTVTIKRVQGLTTEIASKASIDMPLEISAEPGGMAIDLLKEVESVDPTGDAIVRALADHGVKAKVTDVLPGLAFTRYRVEPHKGVKVKDLVSKAEDLMVNIGFASEPIISPQPGAVAIDIPRPQRVFARYEDYIDEEKPKGLSIPVGVNQLTGELVWLDFTDSNCPHFLLGGATGGGKSELYRAMVTALMQFYSNQELHLLLIDTKKSSFTEFKECPHLIGGGVATRPVLAAAAMIKMVKVVENRQEKRETVGAKDLASYNSKVEKPLPRILIFVEELKDVLDALKMVSPADLEQLQSVISESMGADIKVGYKTGEMKPRDVLLMAIDRIAQIGRSEGVHLGIATQDPDKKLLDTIISNLPVQIGLKTRSAIESGTLMPGVNADCHKLLGKGDLYLNVPGQPLQRLQSLFADESVISSVVSKACRSES